MFGRTLTVAAVVFLVGAAFAQAPGEEGSDPEEYYREIAETYTQSILDKYYESTISPIHESGDVPAKDLLSDRLLGLDHVVESHKRNIRGLHVTIKRLILQAAADIENNRFGELERKMGNISYTPRQEKLAEQLVAGQKKVHISYESMALAIGIFNNLNNGLIQDIEEFRRMNPSWASNDQQVKVMYELVLKNSILVYELVDIITEMLAEFQLHGASEIRTIHDTVKSEMLQNREADAKLRDEGLEDVSEPLRTELIQDIDNRIAGYSLMETAWEGILVKLGTIESNADELTRKRADYVALKRIAEGRVKFLELVGITRSVEMALAAIDSFPQPDELRLEPLTVEFLYKLFGLESLPIERTAGR
ncbi:hypothetical protein N9971_00235 [bacterium]|nr:hypothetical protein [bacterium]